MIILVGVTLLIVGEILLLEWGEARKRRKSCQCDGVLDDDFNCRVCGKEKYDGCSDAGW